LRKNSHNPKATQGRKFDFTSNPLFSISILFFRYTALIMSLHDQVADISFRGQSKKNAPQLKIQNTS
jgi:hypothetical protein